MSAIMKSGSDPYYLIIQTYGARDPAFRRGREAISGAQVRLRLHVFPEVVEDVLPSLRWSSGVFS
jgi:hypothetical protein